VGLFFDGDRAAGAWVLGTAPVAARLIVISYQLSVISYQLSVIRCQMSDV
jgi:hypothetical protein